MWVVLVVGLSVETVAVDALVLKSLLNAVYAVVTKLDVDGVVTSVVVGPTSELVAVALVVHNVSNCVYNLHLERSDVRLTSWIVDSSQRSVADDVVNNIVLGALVVTLPVQAVVELVLEVADLSISLSKLVAESVELGSEVLILWANGNNGCIPLSLAKLISETELYAWVLVPSLVAPTVDVLLNHVETEVEEEVNVLAKSEAVEQTSLEGEVTAVRAFLTIVGAFVLPATSSVGLVVVEVPASRSTSINYSVVEATGLVTAEPVSNVEQNIAGNTDAIELLSHYTLSVILHHVAHVGAITDGARVVGSTLHLLEVTADANTQQWREPLTDEQVSLRSEEALAELHVSVFVRHHNANTACGLDEPIVLHTIEDVALSGILNVLNLLSVNCRSQEKSTCTC